MNERPAHTYDVFISYSHHDADWVHDWLLPRLEQASAQAYTLNALALAYQFSGQPGRAAPL